MDLDVAREPMNARKRVVMIAHDNCKHDLLDWAAFNVGTLSRHDLSATGTTGRLLSEQLGLQHSDCVQPINGRLLAVEPVDGREVRAVCKLAVRTRLAHTPHRVSSSQLPEVISGNCCCPPYS